MINPIWLAPVVAGVAYLYFKWEDRKWEMSISSFWNRELGAVNDTDLQRFMSYKSISKGEKSRGLPSIDRIDFKTRVINTVRELLKDMEYLDDSRIVANNSDGRLVFEMSLNDLKVQFWIGNSIKYRRVYKVKSNKKEFEEGELAFVNGLLTDKDKQTIQNYKEFLVNGG